MTIPLSFLSDISPRPPTSLGDLIAERITASGTVNTLLDCLCSTSSPAIHSPDPSRPSLSHADMRDFIASSFVLPHSRFRRPLAPVDRVMVVLPTGPENALALVALACYYTAAPVNASCTATELKEDAVRLHARAIVTTEDAAEHLELRALQCELDCEIIYLHRRIHGPAGIFDMTLLGDDVIFPSAMSTPHELDDKSLILHTSGTSGKKKVVPYTLRSLIIGTWSVVHSWGLKPNDVNLNMMPLFHVGGIVRNLLAPLFSGGSAIMCTGFDPIAFWTLAFQLQATWYYASPTVHHAILNTQPPSARNTKIRMICNAAGGLLPSLAVDLKTQFHGAVILPSYGMTECMPVATPPTNYQLERPGCSGIACGPYLSIRDPSNRERELSPGETGAVSVRGIPTFEGYEVSPEPSVPLDRSVFSSEGWFDSGDVGFMDADGYLYITGRSKEIINKGGEVISPFEVEEAIISACKKHVKATLAFAVEHDVLQETIGLVLVRRAGVPRLSLSQLYDQLKDHLHPSKWPFLIVYTQDLPKNIAGKPLRIKLAKRYGLGVMNDGIPLAHRHFEAECPDPLAALSTPIACQKVVIDLGALEYVLKSTPGVSEAAIHIRQDGKFEAFVTMAGSGTVDVAAHISTILPGYNLPDPLHIMSQPLTRNAAGQIDFDAMAKEIVTLNELSMNQTALIVRQAIADVISIEPKQITLDSDFFLLGGNSLLLGKLASLLRKQCHVSVPISALFINSSVAGIVALIEADGTLDGHTKAEGGFMSDTTLNHNWYDESATSSKSRGSGHVLSLLIQAIPFIFFYPLRAALTWTIMWYMFSFLPILEVSFLRLVTLICALVTARFTVRTVAPLAAIMLKWIVIGRYKAGTYRFWSCYYLRWWIVDQALSTADRGIFKMHPSLMKVYYRLLGAHIGNNVTIENTKLGEFDLIHLEDGCRIDSSLVRGFCVERGGFFRLDCIRVGKDAVVNTYTQISPGSSIQAGTVYGPHSSSLEEPSPSEYASYNRTVIRVPNVFMRCFAWLVIMLVKLLSCIPWMVVIWYMVQTEFVVPDGNALVGVVYWFALPERIMYHTISCIVRAVVVPLLHLVLSLIVKRLLGLNTPCRSGEQSQWTLTRRYINSILLSQEKLQGAFTILGSHYEVVSVVYRCMGAKVGKCVYWPGSGIYCLDPELLEIGDNVVFGSRSEVLTTDCIGTEKIRIRDGAMIADRCVLLPGILVGRSALLGSGTLTSRGATYKEGSTWMGSDGGQAVCFNQGGKESDTHSETITPFGRAFYQRQANFFVIPYAAILTFNIVIVSISAVYWSASAVAVALVLKQVYIHFAHHRIFDGAWYHLAIIYAVIGGTFIIVLNIQGFFVLGWIVLTKWIVIGRRRPGSYDWDKSSYCQRWQLHLNLIHSLSMDYGTGGILKPLAGTLFMVWYLRALGAKIGRNCAVYAGGKVGLMTEPDLVELGDDVALDDCSVVAHINSRGNFALNPLKIGNGCALRSGSRLLSGASMDDNSMLCEHTLLTSGEVAEVNGVYVGWPAKSVIRKRP